MVIKTVNIIKQDLLLKLFYAVALVQSAFLSWSDPHKVKNIILDK